MNEDNTNFLQFACRLSGEDVAALAKQNALTSVQENEIRVMMAQFVSRIKIHVYYKQIKENQVLALMTLGRACDQWCECFLKNERIWNGYMADQIAMRGLMSGYEVFRNVLKKQYETEVSPLHFLDAQTGEMTVEQVFKQLSQTEVCVRKTGQMSPLKSVIFTVDILHDENGKMPKQIIHKELCNSCGNTGCPNRVMDLCV